MPASTRFRDSWDRVIPVWLRMRPGLDVGYRIGWSVMAMFDAALDHLFEGLNAADPTPDNSPEALRLIGRGRGIIRGEADTAEEYCDKLVAWLDTWILAGSMEAIAKSVHEYIAGRPRVSVYSRSGVRLTVEADGTVTYGDSEPFDWDSAQYPERSELPAPWWSDLWVVIYPGYQHDTGTWGDGSVWGEDDGMGMGHDVTREAYAAIRGLLAQWKAAHSRIVAVVWAQDEGFPGEGGPDGWWGNWGLLDEEGHYGPSHRDYSACRFWIPK